MKTKIIIGLTAILLTSCSNKEASPNAHTSKPVPDFDHATFSEVTPMLDGSAYAESMDSRLWYLRGNKAVRVTVTSNDSQQAPEFSEITPLIDGSAYAISLESDSSIWYLHAEHAEKVSEVASMADTEKLPKISDRAFYALYLSEHKKRKDAEDVVNNPPEPPDDSNGSY